MKIKRHIVIRSDAETVFRHLAEPDLLMSWIPSMRNFEFISDVEGGDLKGARFSYQVEGNTFTGEVLEYEPVSHYTAFFCSQGYEYTDRFVLNFDGNATVLTGDMDVRFKTLFWKCVGLLLAFSIKADADLNMRKLKRAVESYRMV